MNSRSAQVIAALLAFMLIVLIGATIFILLSRPNTSRPTPSPTGTGVAVVSPSGSGVPLPSLSGSPTLTPEISPTPSLVPTVPPTDTASPEPTITIPPTPSPSPSPTPTPSPTLPPPTSAQRELTLVEVGLERTSDIEGIERIVSFGVDGPSLISVQLSNLSAGKVRVCISREAQDPQRECVRIRNGTMTRAVFDSGHSDWHVSLIAPEQPAQPFVTVTLRFNALNAQVQLANFRFNGTIDPHYNGFIARLTARESGDLRLQADFEGDSYQWHFVLTRTGDPAPLVDQSGGPDDSIDVGFPLTSGETYRVEFSEPEELAGGGLSAAFVRATITWP